MMPKQEKHLGPIFGVLIIVLILIIGALYFLGPKFNAAPAVDEQTSVLPSETNSSMAAAAGEADDVDTLQADLNAEMKDVDYSF